MSEWGELFATLSRGSDTLDTLRHNAPAPPEDAARPSPIIAPVRWAERAAVAGEPGFELASYLGVIADELLQVLERPHLASRRHPIGSRNNLVDDKTKR